MGCSVYGQRANTRVAGDVSTCKSVLVSSAVKGFILTRQQWRTQEIFFFGRGVSTNSVEDRGQRERGRGGGGTLVMGSTQFANE
jgi:hypothetical protein